MTVRELAQLVVDARNAQREYFRTKSSTALEKSKGLEKRLDAACRDVLAQPGLFDAKGDA